MRKFMENSNVLLFPAFGGCMIFQPSNLGSVSMFASTLFLAAASNAYSQSPTTGEVSRAASDSKITFLASHRIPGSALDKSGLPGTLETGNPVANFGGLSAIDYSPTDNSYVVLSDRGPADGESSFPCRFHKIRITLSPNTNKPAPGADAAATSAWSLGVEMLETNLLTNNTGKQLTGSLQALRQWDGSGRCPSLDPEGIRVLGQNLVISDEYGPSIDLFSTKGTLVKEFPRLSTIGLSELRKPPFEIGAFTNRGLEGIAVTPKQTIVGAMQGPLVQDGRIENNKCLGTSTRWFVTKANGESHQWLYPLTNESTGVSEVLAIDESRFLVLERDSLAGAQAVCKHIYLADASKASDISDVASVRNGLPANRQPIAKKLLIDLLNPAYGFNGETAPERPEGLAWGPSLPDGRKLLVVCYDNDFVLEQDTIFAAFAIEPAALTFKYPVRYQSSGSSRFEIQLRSCTDGAASISAQPGILFPLLHSQVHRHSEPRCEG